jgi:tRNA(Ile)-lysidine synthase
VLSGEEGADERLFVLEPVLSPYDRYLPVFDLPLANALAGLFGRNAYAAPPNAQGCDPAQSGKTGPDAP